MHTHTQTNISEENAQHHELISSISQYGFHLLLVLLCVYRCREKYSRLEFSRSRLSPRFPESRTSSSRQISVGGIDSSQSMTL